MDVTNALIALGPYFPLIAFAAAVVADDVAGVALAIKAGTFDANKLPSFLKSQFGTVKAGVVLAAALTAYYTGGDVKGAALAVVVAGGSALTVSVVSDLIAKVKAFFSKAPAAPAAPAAKK